MIAGCPRASRSLLVGLGLVGLLGCKPKVEAPRRPNVLLVSLDTTRWDVVGAYGAPFGATPHLDAIAAQGVRFDRAYTVTPLTIPAHSSMFTGLYPPRHGVRDNGDFFLDEGAVTFAELLRGAGYHTMASVAAEVTSHHWGFAQGFDAFYDDLGPTDLRANRWSVERPAVAVIDDALGWLEAPERAEAPWFAWIHLFDAHHPYEPPLEYAKRYADRAYVGEVAYADAQLGRVFEALRARGVLDDTLVMVVADHGEGMGEHGEGQHGMLLYNATMKIPMIVRPPGGLPAPRGIDTPTSLVDLLPTALAFAGVAPPDGLDGLDLSPTLAPTPGALPADRDVYLESLYAHRHYGWAPQHGLVDATHKLIDSTTPELYAAADVRERADRAGDDASRVAAMRATLGAKRDAMDAGDASVGRAELSGERLAQLAALGYLTTVADAPTQTDGLPDPKERMPVLRKMEEARVAQRAREFEDAERIALEVLNEEPGLTPPRILLVDVARATGRYAVAVERAREAVAHADGSQTRALLGVTLMEVGRPVEALEQLEKAIEIDPYLVGAWSAYLHLVHAAGDQARLLEAVARASEHLPDSPTVVAMQGLIRVQSGDVASGEPLLREAIASDNRVPLAHYFLGVAAERRGDEAEAAEYFARESELMPGAIPPRLKLVAIYGKQGRWAEQLVHIERLRVLEPPNPGNRFARGLALFNLERYDEALVDAQSCREKWPEDAQCAVLLANVLAKLGRRAEADAVYAEAKALAGQ